MHRKTWPCPRAGCAAHIGCRAGLNVIGVGFVNIVLKPLKQRADVVDKHGIITAFVAHFVVVGAGYGVPGHAIGDVNQPGGPSAFGWPA
jgi:hypothetical protein